MRIVDFFKRIFNKKTNPQTLNGQRTRYSEYVEFIDDFELSKMFIMEITPELESARIRYGGGKTYNYPLQTQISIPDSIEIAKRFFESIDADFAKKVNDIIFGNNPNIILETQNVNHAETTGPNERPVKVRVPIRGDIRQLYEFIHECTHTFDIDNGWTDTRHVLGEVAPQCMERLLDDFLLEMSDEEMHKYGFDRKILERDIRDRRISTFYNRLWNVEALNEFDEFSKGKISEIDRKYPTGDPKTDSRYMLAQIYSAHFNKFDKSQKRNRLISFIQCVNNDDFYGANRCFKIQIDRNSEFERKKYIHSTILEVDSLVRTIIPKEKNIRIEEKTKHKLAKKGKYVTGKKLGSQAVADMQDIEITDKESAEIAREPKTNSQTKENQDIGE